MRDNHERIGAETRRCSKVQAAREAAEALARSPPSSERPSSYGDVAATGSTNNLVQRGDSNWETDQANCSVCNAKLGKRFMNPRHHCKTCGKSVCNKCSPSTVMFPGGLQRVCTPCTSNAFAVGGSFSGTAVPGTSICTDTSLIQKGDWEADAANCTVCKEKVGKRFMNPRHHCKTCGKCVCNKCSPSSVMFPQGGMQRICTPCASNAFAVGGSFSAAS